MASKFLLVFLVLQGLICDQSWADVHQPSIHSGFGQKIKLSHGIAKGDDNDDSAETSDWLSQQCDKEADTFGVERSSQPFRHKPDLYKDIVSEIKPRRGRNPKTSVQLAVEMLQQQDFTGPQSQLIKAAWKTALNRTENLGEFKALPAEYKSDPVKVAAHVYSMAEAFDGKKLYAIFNDITSRHQANGSSYESYPFKGLYGLLLLNMKPYTMETYRGVSYPVAAEKNKFIRFNRFLSTSVNKEVSLRYAGPKGTLFLIKGNKMANFITPNSQVPGEDEYLMPPDAQFLILDVDKTQNPIVVTMQTVEYSKRGC